MTRLRPSVRAHRAPVAVMLGAAAVAVLAPPARAYHFECRWVERVGFTDTVIGGDGASVAYLPGTSHRIRIQFGVFDDDQGPAPAGGFITWNIGTLSTTSGVNSRTPGRLGPFTFGLPSNANGQPPTDPFTSLTDIDAAFAIQGVVWNCTPDGQVPPMPPPVPVGLNTFVSVFEITTLVNGPNHIAAGGRNIASPRWDLRGYQEPDCGDPADPSDDVPGFVEYHAVADLPGRTSTCSLDIALIPAPGAAWLGALVVAAAARRRR